MSKPKLDYGSGYNETNSICITWCIDDIRNLRGTFEHRDVDLTDEECMEILQRVKKNHDTSIGITWETICLEHDYYLEERKKRD